VSFISKNIVRFFCLLLFFVPLFTFAATPIDISSDSRDGYSYLPQNFTFSCPDSLVNEISIGGNFSAGGTATLKNSNGDTVATAPTINGWGVTVFSVPTPFDCDDEFTLSATPGSTFLSEIDVPGGNSFVTDSVNINYIPPRLPALTVQISSSTPPVQPTITPVFFIDYLSTSTCLINASGTTCTHEYDQATTTDPLQDVLPLLQLFTLLFSIIFFGVTITGIYKLVRTFL